MRIILASTSPRRKELMEKIGIPFEIKPSSYQEDMSIDKNPRELVKKLSYNKAKAIVNDHSDSIIIGADTIVVINDKIMGKPKSEQDAANMLKNLSNKPHSVFTGFTIINTKNKQTITKAVETKIYFKELSDKQIKEYIATKEPMDKAGAYAIQGRASKFIEKIEGSYYNVMGLPIDELKKDLENII